MKKLIVNADDFGLHPLINKGLSKVIRRALLLAPL